MCVNGTGQTDLAVSDLDVDGIASAVHGGDNPRAISISFHLATQVADMVTHESGIAQTGGIVPDPF